MLTNYFHRPTLDQITTVIRNLIKSDIMKDENRCVSNKSFATFLGIFVAVQKIIFCIELYFVRTGLNIIILYVNQPSVLSAAFFTLSTRAAQLAALCR